MSHVSPTQTRHSPLVVMHVASGDYDCDCVSSRKFPTVCGYVNVYGSRRMEGKVVEWPCQLRPGYPKASSYFMYSVSGQRMPCFVMFKSRVLRCVLFRFDVLRLQFNPISMVRPMIWFLDASRSFFHIWIWIATNKQESVSLQRVTVRSVRAIKPE